MIFVQHRSRRVQHSIAANQSEPSRREPKRTEPKRSQIDSTSCRGLWEAEAVKACVGC